MNQQQSQHDEIDDIIEEEKEFIPQTMLDIILSDIKPSKPTIEDIQFMKLGKCNTLNDSFPRYCSVELSEKCYVDINDCNSRERAIGFTAEGKSDEIEVRRANIQGEKERRHINCDI